jgi:hypothetical protein
MRRKAAKVALVVLAFTVALGALIPAASAAVIQPGGESGRGYGSGGYHLGDGTTVREQVQSWAKNEGWTQVGGGPSSGGTVIAPGAKLGSSTVRRTLALADELIGPSGVISGGSGTPVAVEGGKRTALLPGEEKSSGAFVGVVTLERQDGPNVWYRTEKREVAGPEEFVRREVLSSQVERVPDPPKVVSRVPFSYDLGARTQQERNGPFLLTTVIRSFYRGERVTYAWDEWRVDQVASVYRTPYYWDVAVTKFTRIPGHYETQRQTVTETQRVPRYATDYEPVYEYYQVPIYENRPVQKVRWVEAPVYETRQVPIYENRPVQKVRWVEAPVYETRVVGYKWDWQYNPVTGRWVKVRVPIYQKVQVGTKLERQVYWATEPVIVGYRTERVQTGVKLERQVYWATEPVIVGYRTEKRQVDIRPVKKLVGYDYVTTTRVVETPVWVEEKVTSQEVQRYTTTTPHRYSYREAVATERVFLGSRTAEARSGDVVAERSTSVSRIDWTPEPPPAAASSGGPKPPKVVPVITVVDSAKYPWSNYSRYRQQIVQKLERLEGQLWDMVREKAARDLTMDELQAAYGKPLLEMIR